MATVEGIDKLGQSLLSQSFSKRKQLRDDVKKQQKRARNVALVGGALRFVDGIVRDQHANWFEGEANRNATRFLKQHQTYLTERQKYLVDVRDSGKSAEDYEIDLLRTFLPEEKLKSRLTIDEILDTEDPFETLEPFLPEEVYPIMVLAMINNIRSDTVLEALTEGFNNKINDYKKKNAK